MSDPVCELVSACEQRSATLSQKLSEIFAYFDKIGCVQNCRSDNLRISKEIAGGGLMQTEVSRSGALVSQAACHKSTQAKD